MGDETVGTRLHDDPPVASAEGSHFGVLVIGAGLSGIGAACQLVRKRSKTTFAILEARSAIGGTWDLFRYPGIRSDSDMATRVRGLVPLAYAAGDAKPVAVQGAIRSAMIPWR